MIANISERIDRQQQTALALRIFCEARLACGERTQGKLNDITIYAPADNLTQWLAPFTFKSVSDESKIAEIAEWLGSAGEVASRLLEAVRTEDDAQISSAAMEFLKAPQFE